MENTNKIQKSLVLQKQGIRPLNVSLAIFCYRSASKKINIIKNFILFKKILFIIFQSNNYEKKKKTNHPFLIIFKIKS